MTAETNKAVIVRAWESAYADREDGRNASPSADDLAMIAHGVDPTLPHGEEVADAIYEAQNDGNDLETVYTVVYGGR